MTSASAMRTRRARSHTVVITFVSAFAIVLVGAAMWRAGVLPSHPAAEGPQLYTGVIRIMADRPVPCRQLEFDNRSGSIRTVSWDSCRGDPEAASTEPVGGSIGRMLAIAHHFKAH
jgi:hypothetical protein